jgi:hypothetical protein
MKKYFIIALSIFLLIGCQKPSESTPVSPVNLSHVLSLVDSLSISDQIIYFIHIYAEAPDYKPVEAKDEGVSCVDDVGRFMEVLETEILEYKRTDLLPIVRGMTRFLLYMCRDDGLWYNFINADGEINRDYRTSKAGFEWWAARGIRGLAAAYNIFCESKNDRGLLDRIKGKIETTVPLLEKALESYPQTRDTEFGERPAWLIKDAPDINSELLIALTKLHRTGDFDYSEAIQKISKGLIEYQYCAKNHDLDGMYFCWKNIWHNWGNNQAYALLEAFKITGDSTLFYSVKTWADSFIPFLIENNIPREITLNSKQTYKKVDFPQIAYGINSLYRGMKSFADINNNDSYTERAETIFSWFTGQNMARISMYDPETGRCYDGINEDLSVNLNSGAESTIECLLAILMRGRI